jgi:hypothetical protein
MNTAPVFPRVRVIIELPETLFDCLQITAAQRGQTMTALCESALRETQLLPRRPGEQGFIARPPSQRIAGPGRPPARAQELPVPAHQPKRVRTKPASWQQAL